MRSTNTSERHGKTMHMYLVLAAILIAWAPELHSRSRDEDTTPHASAVLRSSRAAGGICVVLGGGVVDAADLAVAMHEQGGFVVQCVSASSELTSELRERIRRSGLYGPVTAVLHQGTGLPYADNLVNIVVIASGASVVQGGVSTEEVLRVLAPLGTVHLPDTPQTRDWHTRLLALGAESVGASSADSPTLCARKTWPPEIDEWTHYLHGADGNPVAQDREVGPPERCQWVSEPRWQRSHESDSSISTLVTARGRLFYIVDEAPISLTGQHDLPDKWSLTARDAFNGMFLWKVPIARWGWREWKPSWFNTRPGDIPLNLQKRLVAVGDRVHVTLGYRAPVTTLDARTGRIVRTYEGSEGTNEILATGDDLIFSIVSGRRVDIAAFDAASGSRKWKTERKYRGTTVDYIRWKAMRGETEPAELDPSPNIATDGRVVALIDGTDIVLLDAGTGAERWRASFPTAEADLSAGRMRSEGNLWNGTMIVSGGMLLHASPTVLAAFSIETGKLAWKQPKRFIQHLWYEWKDVFVIGDIVWTWTADLKRGRSLYPAEARGYDIHDGTLKRSVPLGTIFNTHHHHRCYRNKATVRYILASRRGTEFVDLEEGRHTVHNWVRGTCHLGMMPANGLQYAPPHPCQCYIQEKLNGMHALAPAGKRSASPSVEPPRAEPERGAAYGAVPSNRADTLADSDDWPTFRADTLRSGAGTSRLPDGLRRLWRARLGKAVSAPVAVGDHVITSLTDQHEIVCLDAREGKRRWSFTAGGRVDGPPTYHRGALLFGSADGRLTCLRASDGELAWRRPIAPGLRLVGAYEQIESAWPVHGSVLVLDGTVYAAAGRSSQLDGGVRIVGVDARTGDLRCETTLAGPDYAVGDFEENYQLPMGSLPDILLGDDDSIYMRSEAFDRELRPKTGRPPLRVPGGFLDGSYFKRIPWTVGKQHARIAVHDEKRVYCVRMFDTLRGLDPTVFFTPGRKGYLVFATDMSGKKLSWQRRVPIRVRAMALAHDRLAIAGPPDVVDPSDPLAAFEGRRGGHLQIVDVETGENIAEHALSSPPVFHGAAIAGRRLFVAEEDGSITCFGAP